MTSLFGLFKAEAATPRPVKTRTVVPTGRRFRPAVEALEGRVVLAASLAAPPLAPALAAPVARQAGALVPIVINNVVNVAGNLLANASLGGTNFQIPLTLSVPAGQAATSTTQILNLHLGPIDLNLLGLRVQTSEICLNITAQSGTGNLLGNLLTQVAGLLDQGIPLNQVLGGLSPADLGTLTTGVTGLLNGALGQLTSPANAASGASVTQVGATHILHLSVGPLNLNLLGLQVNLDNCHNGPITVDITAQSGPGQLLGNLLGGLSHLLDSNANVHALINKIDRIADRILALL